MEDDYVSLDVETTNLDKGSALNTNNKLVLACWYVVKDGTVTKKHHFGDEYDQKELLEDIANAKFVLAHNAKFEAQWLKRCGQDLTKVLLYDTMLGQWVVDANIKTEKSLEALSKRYLKGQSKLSLVSKLIKNGVCPSTMPRKWLLPYCFQDVELCTNLFEVQRQELYIRHQLHIVHVRNLTCSVLADIEFNGMTLDKGMVELEFQQTSKRAEQALHKLQSMADGVNFNSPKQLGELLYDKLGFKELTDRKGNLLRTPAGGRATSSDVLSNLVAKTAEQEEFLSAYKEFSKNDSLLSKNLSFFRGVCEENNGTFYGNFNQSISATHRLTGTGRPLLFKDAKTAKSVQFQNLPRDYKRLFTSPGMDYFVAEADGAQLEFRVAVDLCRDSVGYDDICNDVDVHSITAEKVTENGQPTNRQDAKALTFKPLFGGMSGTKAERAYFDAFLDKYQNIATEQEAWTYQAAADKQVVTRYGMIYFYPNARINTPKFKGAKPYVEDTTIIKNYTVQGFATAEIIPIAMVHFWHRVQGKRIKIVNTVHDSIIALVHKDEVKEYEVAVKQSLTTDVFKFLKDIYNYEFIVPLGVGVKLGTHWGTSDLEQIWDVWPDGKEKYKRKEK